MLDFKLGNDPSGEVMARFNRRIRIALGSLFLLCASAPAVALTCTWTGAVDANWNLPGNWAG